MSTYGQEPPADPWRDGEATAPTPPAEGSFGAPPTPPAAPYSPPLYHTAGPTYAQPMAAPQYAPVPQPGYAPQPGGYAPQPGYPQPANAELAYGHSGWQQPKQKSTVMIVLITLLVVVVLAGAGVGTYLYLNKADTSTPEFIPQVNTCIALQDSDQIARATCGTPGSYKVLQEIPVPTADATVARERCASVTGNKAEAWFHVQQGSGQDYVLCLDTATS